MREAEYLDDVTEELLRLELVAMGRNSTYETLLNDLTTKITYLINNNFSSLIQLLYQIDIPENKLRALLKQQENSAAIIAQAIIERQVQKIETRKAFKKEDDIPEDERW